MTAFRHGAAGPDDPAGRVAYPFLLPRFPARRIPLRPSAWLLVLPAIALLVAVGAFHAALAPLPGHGDVLLSLAFLAAGALALKHWHRRPPALFEIGPDGMAAFARDGSCLVRGRLAGQAQWGGWLLVIVIDAGRKAVALPIAADAASADDFRELAVRGRRASGRLA
ncbi:hypothetical protein CY652_10255 [Burkholderia sp. WAC0059]|uniref:hypothetical protein n=1 Tax=Burkholderia sp. WAC0059 TaxID=2066022 RepID=UPI000C7E866B|nr:hypothetical protein [Burkholderia sp. WAC0059]PLZ02495.1 hypothetical protein CY652_10255 [Burkholderia sp. WAC0059]